MKVIRTTCSQEWKLSEYYTEYKIQLSGIGIGESYYQGQCSAKTDHGLAGNFLLKVSYNGNYFVLNTVNASYFT